MRMSAHPTHVDNNVGSVSDEGLVVMLVSPHAHGPWHNHVDVLLQALLEIQDAYLRAISATTNNAYNRPMYQENKSKLHDIYDAWHANAVRTNNNKDPQQQLYATNDCPIRLVLTGQHSAFENAVHRVASALRWDVTEATAPPHSSTDATARPPTDPTRLHAWCVNAIEEERVFNVAKEYRPHVVVIMGFQEMNRYGFEMFLPWCMQEYHRRNLPNMGHAHVPDTVSSRLVHVTVIYPSVVQCAPQHRHSFPV